MEWEITEAIFDREVFICVYETKITEIRFLEAEMTTRCDEWIFFD